MTIAKSKRGFTLVESLVAMLLLMLDRRSGDLTMARRQLAAAEDSFHTAHGMPVGSVRG